jgi:hypothetical protein
MADKIIGPDDFELAKVYSYGEKPERQKRQLSPEMEQAVKDTSGLGALIRGATNSATFDQADRLAAKMGGGPIEDQWEMSQRIKDAHPWMSLAGDVLGLGAQTALTGGASLIPRLAGAGLLRTAAREGINAGGQALADNLIKTAEGREELSPGKVLAGAAGGSVLGAAASQIPRVLGHAPSIAASTRSTPLSAAERTDIGAARQHAERFNFTGDAGLDLAQLARLSENPTLAAFAAKAERVKANATPGTGTAQETAFQNRGLDRLMADSVPAGAAKYPKMSGKEIGQERIIPRETVVDPVRPLPPEVQRALDDAYNTRVAGHAGRTLQPGGPNYATPQPNEMKMWDDVIDQYRGRYPINRADREAARGVLGDSGDPLLRNRMIAEQRAEDVSRIKNAVRDAPATPSRWPDQIELSGSVGGRPTGTCSPCGRAPA